MYRTVSLPFLLVALLLTGCATGDRAHTVLISVPDQQMAVLHYNHLVASYPISTSKFGLGDNFGSCATPLGRMEVAKKYGQGQPVGAVFKSRKPTGERVAIDAPGRDPIVTRILWLRGKERENMNTFRRCIYIHGTPEERNIGHPVSYGCIRMRSHDVVALYDRVGVGAEVEIQNRSLTEMLPAQPVTAGAHY